MFLNFLDRTIIYPIKTEAIINKYAEIDAYSQGKHPTIELPTSARNMGKNDLWIAATASVLDATLLTMDKDFDHLNEVFLNLKCFRNKGRNNKGTNFTEMEHA